MRRFLMSQFGLRALIQPTQSLIFYLDTCGNCLLMFMTLNPITYNWTIYDTLIFLLRLSGSADSPNRKMRPRTGFLKIVPFFKSSYFSTED
jgi:hypothetical protein